MSVLQSNITDVVNAIALWGPKGNRGSRADLLSLRSAAVTLSQTLKSLSQYVMNTAQTAAGSDYPDMADILSTSGFDVLTVKHPQGVLQPVVNFHAAVSPRYNPNQVKLLWHKPLDAPKGNVKSYRVLRGTTAVFSAATQIAVVTKGRYIDTNTTGTVQTWFYFVVAVNDAGDGAMSEVVSVTLLSV